MSFSEAFSTVMKVRRFVMIGTAIIGSLGGAGYKYGPTIWHKTDSHPASKVAAANAAAAANLATNGIVLKPGGVYLGELMLTNHCETSVQLGDGKNCTLLARGDGRGMHLTVSLKSCTSDGQTRDLSVTQVSAKSGKPVEIALGDYDLAFTPKIAN
jgi:hypothetical protein